MSHDDNDLYTFDEIEDPQPEHGTIRIARIIEDALNCINLTKNEMKAIRLVFRLSYGCKGHRTCRVDQWVDFEYCVGLHRTKVRDTLEKLETKRILIIDWRMKTMCFNKRVLTWNVEASPLWKGDRYAELLKLNIDEHRPEHSTINKKLIDRMNSYKQKGNTINKKLIGYYQKVNDLGIKVNKKLIAGSQEYTDSKGLEEASLDIIDNNRQKSIIETASEEEEPAIAPGDGKPTPEGEMRLWVLYEVSGGMFANPLIEATSYDGKTLSEIIQYDRDVIIEALSVTGKKVKQGDLENTSAALRYVAGCCKRMAEKVRIAKEKSQEHNERKNLALEHGQEMSKKQRAIVDKEIEDAGGREQWIKDRAAITEQYFPEGGDKK